MRGIGGQRPVGLPRLPGLTLQSDTVAAREPLSGVARKNDGYESENAQFLIDRHCRSCRGLHDVR
jgi:hypothetical protein